MAADRVHEPEPGVADWNQAATAREQGSDPDSDLDSRDRTALLVECRVYP